MMVEPLRLKLPFGGYNAGAIVEPDLPSLPVVEQVLIPPDVAKQAVAMFREHGIDCWLFVGNEWLCTNPAGDQVELRPTRSSSRRQSSRNSPTRISRRSARSSARARTMT